MGIPLVLGFLDEDKLGTIQPHDDTLVVTLRIGGYDVKRVMIDQGNAVEIMYPNLYNRLNLKLESLTAYSSPLVSFEGKMDIPKRLNQITRADWLECGRCGFHCGRCFLSIYHHYGQILASYLESCLLHSSLEGEISLWRLGVGDSRKPVYG